MSTAHETVHWHESELTTLSIESKCFFLFCLCVFRVGFCQSVLASFGRASWHTCNSTKFHLRRPNEETHTYRAHINSFELLTNESLFAHIWCGIFWSFRSAPASNSLARSFSLSLVDREWMNITSIPKCAPRDIRDCSCFFRFAIECEAIMCVFYVEHIWM